jgi:hypothetical protein
MRNLIYGEIQEEDAGVLNKRGFMNNRLTRIFELTDYFLKKGEHYSPLSRNKPCHL